MTDFQRVVKYLAIAFGIFIILSIFSSMILFFSVLFGISVGVENAREENSKVMSFSQTYENVNNITVDINSAKFEIKQSEDNTVKVEASDVNKKFSSNMHGDTLIIKEKKNSFLFGYQQSDIVIYVPKDKVLDKVTIDTGINQTKIEQLSAKHLDLDLGVGEALIHNVTAKRAKIDAGAGRTEMVDCDVTSLSLNAGVGEFVYNGSLTGRTKIDGGVGRILLNLNGSKADYQIMADSGLTDVRIDGQSGYRDISYGEGTNIIDIDGGVGQIEVNFGGIPLQQENSQNVIQNENI